MDMAIQSMQESLRSVQSAISMSTLKKAMNQDTQAMSTVLNDMAPATPAVSARGVGSKLNVTA